MKTEKENLHPGQHCGIQVLLVIDSAWIPADWPVGNTHHSAVAAMLSIPQGPPHPPHLEELLSAD